MLSPLLKNKVKSISNFIINKKIDNYFLYFLLFNFLYSSVNYSSSLLNESFDDYSYFVSSFLQNYVYQDNIINKIDYIFKVEIFPHYKIITKLFQISIYEIFKVIDFKIIFICLSCLLAANVILIKRIFNLTAFQTAPIAIILLVPIKLYGWLLIMYAYPFLIFLTSMISFYIIKNKPKFIVIYVFLLTLFSSIGIISAFSSMIIYFRKINLKKLLFLLIIIISLSFIVFKLISYSKHDEALIYLHTIKSKILFDNFDEFFMFIKSSLIFFGQYVCLPFIKAPRIIDNNQYLFFFSLIAICFISISFFYIFNINQKENTSRGSAFFLFFWILVGFLTVLMRDKPDILTDSIKHRYEIFSVITLIAFYIVIIKRIQINPLKFFLIPFMLICLLLPRYLSFFSDSNFNKIKYEKIVFFSKLVTGIHVPVIAQNFARYIHDNNDIIFHFNIPFSRPIEKNYTIFDMNRSNVAIESFLHINHRGSHHCLIDFFINRTEIKGKKLFYTNDNFEKVYEPHWVSRGSMKKSYNSYKFPMIRLHYKNEIDNFFQSNNGKVEAGFLLFEDPNFCNKNGNFFLIDTNSN